MRVPPNNVIVIFGDAIPQIVRGPMLLQLEIWLRQHNVDAEVFMETMRDQNKLRRDLTREDVI